MKTEKEILSQRRRINRWIDSLNYDNPVNRETISDLCAYYDVLSWVVMDNTDWVKHFGLAHVIEKEQEA